MEQLNLTVDGAYVVEELNWKNNFHIFKNYTAISAPPKYK